MMFRTIPSILVAYVLLSGCRAQVLEAEALPFHLAVAPFESAEVERPLSVGEERGERLLELDGTAVAREFVAQLDGFAFTRVTLLELPAGVAPAEFATWSPSVRERHWLEAAQSCGADLVFHAELEHDPHVETRLVTSATWPVVLEGLWKAALYSGGWNALSGSLAVLFTVNGWDGEERTHRLHASLDGGFFDPRARLEAGEPSEETGRLARTLRHETELTTSFHERQGWLGHALSFPLVGYFLPSNDEALARSLRERVGEELLSDLVKDLVFQRESLFGGGGLYPFRVEQLALVPAAGGHELVCVVELDPRGVDSMDGYRLWVDGVLRCAENFESSSARKDGRVRYELRVPLGALEPHAEVRLELADGAPLQHVRTFTLRADRTGQRTERQLHLELPRTEARE